MNTDLFNAINDLTLTSRVRLTRDGAKEGQWQQLPSIWEQLQSASRWGNGSGQGGATRFGSRSVISTGLVALVITITEATTEAAVELVGKTRGSVPANLRAISATLRDAEQIGWWTGEIQAWITEARGHLGLDPERPRSVRGVKCPRCHAKTAYRRQDGQVVRMPALSLTWVGPDDEDYHEDHDWRVRAVECKSCGTAWFRGTAMDSLIDAMLEANQSKETMTDPA